MKKRTNKTRKTSQPKTSASFALASACSVVAVVGAVDDDDGVKSSTTNVDALVVVDVVVDGVASSPTTMVDVDVGCCGCDCTCCIGKLVEDDDDDDDEANGARAMFDVLVPAIDANSAMIVRTVNRYFWSMKITGCCKHRSFCAHSISTAYRCSTRQHDSDEFRSLTQSNHE
jgi:hypothetical protein